MHSDKSGEIGPRLGIFNHLLDFGNCSFQVKGLGCFTFPTNIDDSARLQDTSRLAQRQRIALNGVAVVDSLPEKLLLNTPNHLIWKRTALVDLACKFRRVPDQFLRYLIE